MKATYTIFLGLWFGVNGMERPPKLPRSDSEETALYEPFPTHEQISVPATPSSDGGSTSVHVKRKEFIPTRSLKKQRGQEESFSIAYYLKTNPLLILGRIQGDTLDLSYLRISNLDGLASIPGIGRIKHVSLAHNLIREVKREDFAGISHITSLDLSNNLLEFLLVDSFAELSNLTNLFLNDNIIRILQQDAFTGLNTLKQLSLSRNRIKELDDKMLKGVFNLEELDLSNNEITTLEPHIFVSLSFLKKLKLNNNRITQLAGIMFEGFRLKGQSFNGLRYLELLDLRTNKLTEIPTTILARMPALAQLLLADNQIARVTDQNITALKKAVGLKKIDLAGNQLTATGLKKLTRALPNVEIIATAPMEISENVERLMSEFSATKSISDIEQKLLEERRVQEAKKTIVNPVSLRAYLNESFAFERRLNKTEQGKQSYNLSRLNLTSLDGLLDLPYIHTASRIYLNENKLKIIPSRAFFDLGAEDIMLGSNEIEIIDPHAFEEVPQLKAVYLYNNRITALTPEIARQFKNIQLLDLEKNQISMLSLFVFKDLSYLKTLNLSYNRLESLRAEMLVGLENLETLSISHNQLRYVNPSVFAPLKKLTSVDLTGNPLSAEHVAAIKKAFPKIEVFF